MADQGALFRFVAAELARALAPPPGRHLLRGDDGEARTVVVVDAPADARRRRWRSRRARTLPREPVVDLASITVIDVIPQPSEQEALRWVHDVAVESAIAWAVDAIDRVLAAHRVAAADPDVHALPRDGVLIWIAGCGSGEQVARGAWMDARELVIGRPRRRRSEALRTDERRPALLGGEPALLTEELTLRARHDLDHGDIAHAALQLDLAYRAALAELPREDRPDLAPRLQELGALHASVSALAGEALGGVPTIRRETVAGALVRLEAALRARSAGAEAAERLQALAARSRRAKPGGHISS